MVRNLAFQVAYDGTDFVGSQWQANGRSVQGELESAWQRLHGESIRFTLAGRTDAGVHAMGQIANVVTALIRDENSARVGAKSLSSSPSTTTHHMKRGIV